MKKFKTMLLAVLCSTTLLMSPPLNVSAASGYLSSAEFISYDQSVSGKLSDDEKEYYGFKVNEGDGYRVYLDNFVDYNYDWDDEGNEIHKPLNFNDSTILISLVNEHDSEIDSVSYRMEDQGTDYYTFQAPYTGNMYLKFDNSSRAEYTFHIEEYQLSKWTEILDDYNNHYKVIGKNKVAFIAPFSKNQESISIDSTIKNDGIEYEVTQIAANAFKNNKKLYSVYLPDSLISIGNNAFSGCKKLDYVTFPSDLQTIGKNAFYKCSSLQTIEFKGIIKKIGKNAFNGTKNGAYIYVPSKKKYKSLLKNSGLKKYYLMNN